MSSKREGYFEVLNRNFLSAIFSRKPLKNEGERYKIIMYRSCNDILIGSLFYKGCLG